MRHSILHESCDTVRAARNILVTWITAGAQSANTGMLVLVIHTLGLLLDSG